MKFFGLREIKLTRGEVFKGTTNRDLMDLASEIKAELIRRRNHAASICIPINDPEKVDSYDKNLAELEGMLSKLDNVEVPVARSHEN